MKRPRRLRSNERIRDLVRETTISPSDFIFPIFIDEGTNLIREIPSMTGIFRYSLDRIHEELQELVDLNINSVMLFGIPQHKDEIGSSSWSESGIIQTAIRQIKKDFPQLYLIADVCFCEYTNHGHCGVMKGDQLLNDETLKNLEKQAISLAKAGVDMLAPSGMIDRAVGAIRSALDKGGFYHIPIMGYSVKYSSAYYGPFRDAADSAPSFGDRKTYQMDPANRREALREAQLDIEEGADIIMVKPALAYLDMVRDLKERFDLPIAAYNVSGEYAMVKAAAEKGWIDGEKVMMENLLSMKRAGADIILTYHAKEAAKILNAGL